MLKKILVYALIYSLALQPLTVAWAGSDIQADPTALPQQRPQVLSTAGGLPQVNITTPNASGLSYNRYQTFNVGPDGAILNNSRQKVQTQLGGWVEGNPNLAGGTGKLIVNEVNSANPSKLRGHVEVAGDRADVVIANPSGLQVDGFGFINAGRGTLTTGKPQIGANGALTGYRVEGGHIEISGRGLNGQETDYTDIITQSAAINAGIWANDLKVTTGKNLVSRDNTQVTPLEPGSSFTGVSLDVSALGGMYAGKIKLVGTAQGLGVKNSGKIVAHIGEVVITNDGRLESSGVISGQKAVKIKTKGDIKNTGRVQSPGEIKISSRGKVNNQGGSVVTEDTLKVKAATDIDNSGLIQVRGAANLQAGRNLSNSGSIQSGGDLVLTAVTGVLDNLKTGLLGTPASGHLTSGLDTRNSGQVLANGDLSVTSYKNFYNSGTFQVQNRLGFQIDETLENSGQLLSGEHYAQADIWRNYGLVDGGEVVLKATNIINVDTGSIFGDHIALEAVNILNGASVDTGHAPVTGTSYDPTTGIYFTPNVGLYYNKGDGQYYNLSGNAPVYDGSLGFDPETVISDPGTFDENDFDGEYDESADGDLSNDTGSLLARNPDDLTDTSYVTLIPGSAPAAGRPVSSPPGTVWI
ncbi:MAG: filamentous hemagglutinin N-terminal domain-containing protein [Candidatus Adiutrix sp.]|jgi:filamentous hemagglutinin family protein|nr:filamentous hemagglutinin N-terminal domain-containing protein [Candidatus Adiutrix sp.]